MSTTYVSTSLAPKVMQDLVQHGASVREGAPPIVDVVKEETITAFIHFLKSKGEEGVDPVLIPTFGLPTSAVSVTVQMEVLQLLIAYQPLDAVAFAPDAPLPQIAPSVAVPAGMGFQYPN